MGDSVDISVVASMVVASMVVASMVVASMVVAAMVVGAVVGNGVGVGVGAGVSAMDGAGSMVVCAIVSDTKQARTSHLIAIVGYWW